MPRLLLTGLVIASLLSVGHVSASEICFLSGDRVDGLSKICFYKCATGTVATTIKSHELCPQTLERE